MVTISVINQKGGVGKTTTTLAIANYLTDNKKKVLVVDSDPQGNTTYTSNVEVKGTGMLEVLAEPTTIKERIGKADYDVLPSTPQLANAETLLTMPGREFRLKEALEIVKDKYDYCIIDTPPSLNIITLNSLVASDYVVIPTQADIYSLKGIEQLNATIATVKKYYVPSLKVLGILLTRFNERQKISKDVANVLENKADQLEGTPFKTKIRECVAIKEAELTKVDIFKEYKNTNASKDYSNFMKEMLERMKENG